jgi:hypothetical protein
MKSGTKNVIDGVRDRYGIPLIFSFYAPDAEDKYTRAHAWNDST